MSNTQKPVVERKRNRPKISREELLAQIKAEQEGAETQQPEAAGSGSLKAAEPASAAPVAQPENPAAEQDTSEQAEKRRQAEAEAERIRANKAAKAKTETTERQPEKNEAEKTAEKTEPAQPSAEAETKKAEAKEGSKRKRTRKKKEAAPEPLE